MEAVKEEIKPDMELDLKGLICPVPIAMLQERIRSMKEGEILLVHSTDPGFEYDLWNWSRRSGNEVLKVEKNGSVVSAYIRKTKESRGSSLIYWIRFHALGVKLHARLFFIKLNPFTKKPDHFITFKSISEGLRAEKYLKEKGIKGVALIPIPDEIDPNCGVVIAVNGRKRSVQIFGMLKEDGFGVDGLFGKSENYLVKII